MQIPKILGPHDDFPNVAFALKVPNGLLAMGGDLNVARLLNAYHHGIFPWYTQGEPILWWSPDPRAVIFMEQLKISRSLKKIIRNKNYTVTFNQAFHDVIKACAAPRAKQKKTWITKEMQEAYNNLHTEGFAHSVEVWSEEKLIGGLYGVTCGRIFTGESMFNIVPDASKIALVYLINYLKAFNFFCIDCQMNNPYLTQLGATNIPRTEFIILLKEGLALPKTCAWQDITA